MADLLRNVSSQNHGPGISCSSPPPSSRISQFSASLFSPSRNWRSPQIANEFGKLSALMPHALMQAQDQSSTTSEAPIKWWERDLGITIRDVHSTEELMDTIESSVGKLVVVEFFASWCGSCRALYPKLCKLAKEHKDTVFLKVNFDENKAFCKSLNVKVLPYFHFYLGDLSPIDSFSCSILKLQKLKDALARHKKGKPPADGQDYPFTVHQISNEKIQVEQ